MKREDAERVAGSMAKEVYAFTAGRCATLEDAEDLSQEILLRAFRSLLVRDPDDPVRFVWRIARNALANYYRSKSRHSVGIPIEEIEDRIPDPEDPFERDGREEALGRLRREIAALSKLRRGIVIAYYFEGKKIGEIAGALEVPDGTVKWHLFEARKELKKGMESMRETEQLQYNPVRFTFCGTSGSVGTGGGCGNFFRSVLSQNIAYTVYRESKTVGEIARDLGVSPVYVEGEAEYLEEYGFLTCRGGKYRTNFLIDEPEEAECALRETMYAKGAALIGDGLCDALLSSGLLEDRDRLWGGLKGEMTMTADPVRDNGLLLWTLVPWLAAVSGEAIHDQEETVSFEKAATIRPDGAFSLCQARIDPPGTCIVPDGWCGPAWNRWGRFGIWALDTPWSDRRITEDWFRETEYDKSMLLTLDSGGELRPEEYTRLAERGYTVTIRGDGGIKTGFRCVWIHGSEMQRELIALGDRVKESCWEEIRAVRKPYTDMVLARTPEHLRKMQENTLGYLFHSDGAFLYRCLQYLTEKGRLPLPDAETRRSLCLLVTDETPAAHGRK